jgi:hypothetical protein
VPCASPRRSPKASQNTSMNSTEVATGASTVWVQMVVKRRTSRA